MEVGLSAILGTRSKPAKQILSKETVEVKSKTEKGSVEGSEGERSRKVRMLVTTERGSPTAGWQVQYQNHREGVARL